MQRMKMEVKRMILFALGLLVLGTAIRAGNEYNGLHLLPKPKSIEMTQGFYMVPDKIQCRVSENGIPVANKTLNPVEPQSVTQKLSLKHGP